MSLSPAEALMNWILLKNRAIDPWDSWRKWGKTPKNEPRTFRNVWWLGILANSVFNIIKSIKSFGQGSHTNVQLDLPPLLESRIASSLWRNLGYDESTILYVKLNVKLPCVAHNHVRMIHTALELANATLQDDKAQKSARVPDWIEPFSHRNLQIQKYKVCRHFMKFWFQGCKL